MGVEISESLGSVFEQMEKFFKTETVIGQPIQAGDVTIVPIISVSFGAAKGGGEGKGTDGTKGGAGGAGAGGRITPTAMVVIRGSDVEIMPLTGKTNMERIITQFPDLVTKAKNAVLKREAEESQASDE